MSSRADRRDAARRRGIEQPDLIPHGSQSGYDYWGCKCDRCRAAKHDRWAQSKADVNARRNRRLRQARALKRAQVDVLAAFADVVDVIYGEGEHADHIREQHGKCIYCSCGARVQGKITKRVPA